ncbi:MAG TPA: glycogen debranching N-terminal domain-containing protein [Pseudonocardiaceae bacterium]|jgi:glycogen debranching enzyme|nr:glycogen debranching N-terminal domain-containing protein [Pseudonocardiaceae bacterium]
MTADTASRQPLLHDEFVTLLAPNQVWSDRDGRIGRHGVHGYWTGDQRVVSAISVDVVGSDVEPVATVPESASATVFTALLRGFDGPGADPDVRLDRRLTVGADGVAESVRITSRLAESRSVELVVRIRPDASGMDGVRGGAGAVATPFEVTDDGAGWYAGAVSVTLLAQGGVVERDGDEVVLRWKSLVGKGVSLEARWAVRFGAPDAVVVAARVPARWTVPAEVGDDRLRRWIGRAMADLDALRVRRPGTDDEFLAAGAPWFFTLFGRDSLWAARFLLPVDTSIAASTLRVLAALQGTRVDPDSAEQPGKIMHELRQATLPVDNKRITLPPLYYGTIDATPLWICLLHDAWRAGLPEDEVRALLPALERALAWMRDYGDADGDGLLEYIDESGHGLANQGWKDSHDSIQWRDGSLAEGPIALCECQAYAHEAAMHGADLLDAFGLAGGAQWRAWAGRLAERFRETFWIADERGTFPAIALDARKRPVDTVTSNIGHLIGTGLLNAEEERLVADRLVAPDLAGGYGLRTLSTTAGGYWPLSYHGGSVWPHDTAIAIDGLRRAGFGKEAGQLAEQLIAAAVAFDYRMPELYSGDADRARPTPYPAACRPQAWSAAAAVSVWAALR